MKSILILLPANIFLADPIQAALVETQDVNFSTNIGWVYCFRPLNHGSCASDEAVTGPKTRKSKKSEMLIDLLNCPTDDLRCRIYLYKKAILCGANPAQDKADGFAAGPATLQLSKYYRGASIVRGSRHRVPQGLFSQLDKLFDRLIESPPRGTGLMSQFPQIETVLDSIRGARNSDEGSIVRTDFTRRISPETVVRGHHATVGGNDNGVGCDFDHDKSVVRENLARGITASQTCDGQNCEPKITGTVCGSNMRTIVTEEHGNAVFDISASDTDVSEDGVHWCHLMGGTCRYDQTR